MSTYFGSSINESPTIVLPAGEKIEDARGIAVVIKDGAVVKPDAGAHIIGITLIETDETVEKATYVDVQVKDIGKWAAGEEIAIGTELTTDADGKAVAAKSGDFIAAVALSSAEAAGTWITVQIVKAGYKSAGVTGGSPEGGSKA